MKLCDFIFRFKAPSWCITPAGICRVRLFSGRGGDFYAVLTELDENPSVSVTNAIENIRRQLIANKKIPEVSQIVDHFEGPAFFTHKFDLVTFTPDGHPEWRGLSRTRIEALLECSPTEFDLSTDKDPWLQAEIRKALDGIPPIKVFQYIEPPEISERRLEIAAKMHSRAELDELVHSSANEQTISAFLKEDLSFFSEIYASPKDEYICFSEFPVGSSGRVDFAVFTGRSRMSVYLIEIKAAQHHLLRRNHYQEFTAPIQEGRGQLLSREAWVRSNYEQFRRFVHQVRQSVVDGKRPYHAFPGPRPKLQVDSDKDIHLHFIFIGGHTVDDLKESQKRHQADQSLYFHIETETWDSWIKKLERK